MSVVDLKAAIFSKRQEVRQALRSSLKARGLAAENIHNVLTEEECTTIVSKQDQLILVLDWDIGPHGVSTVLENIATSMKTASHPVLLIASQTSDHILKLGTEYKVAKVALGEINYDTINLQITDLVKSLDVPDDYSETLLKVADLISESKVYGAINHLESAHEAAVSKEVFGVELAELYFQHDRESDAEKLLQEMLNEYPNNARVRHIYARCKLKKQDYEGAIASLKGAQLISPGNIGRLLELGGAYLEIDRADQASAIYEEVLQLAPELKQAKKGQAQSQLLAGEINEGLELIRSSLNPREIAAVFNTAAVIAIRNGKYSEGLSLYKIAVKSLANDDKLASKIVYNMGIGFVKWGKVDRGAACFEKAYSLDGDFYNAKHNLEIAKAIDGESEMSEKEFESFFADEKPENMEAFSVASIFEDVD